MQHQKQNIEKLIARMEERKQEFSPSVYDRVLSEYRNRLDQTQSEIAEPDETNQALIALLERLIATLEEIELRQFADEFNENDIQNSLKGKAIKKPVMELMKMMANLDDYKNSIRALTGQNERQQDDEKSTITFKNTCDLDPLINLDEDEEDSKPFLDIDRVLEDFDAIDVFAEYEEGDAVYDKQYEEEDKQILNEIFFHILDGYLEPLVVGFKAVVSGNNTQKLFGALLASIKPLRRSAETMGFSQLTSAFNGLELILLQAQRAGSMIPADRIQFVKAYGELAKCLPNEGAEMGLIDILDSNKTSNSMVLNLIKSKMVEGWMVQTLLEIGVTTPDKFRKTNAEEIKALTGLPYEHCRNMIQTCRTALLGLH